MSIDFLPYAQDAECTLRCLPAAPDDHDAFSMNVANTNAVDLMLALGLTPEPVGTPMPIDAFAGLVTAALRRHLGRRSPALGPIAEPGHDGSTIIHLGRREGYIEERLGALARLIQRSRAAGATHFGWS